VTVAGKDKDPHERSLREEIAYARLIAELEDMQAWWNRDKLKPGVIPRAGVEAPGPRPRTKITVKFDAEILKWFRGMGLGYQARMNHVLRSWMLSVIAKEIAAGAAGTR
jgi:uncharacterized protein (DUF4415 family)